MLKGLRQELKRAISGDIITLAIAKSHAQNIQNLIRAEPYVKEINESKEGLRISVARGEIALPQLIRLLDNAQLSIENIALSRPSLDDVFLKQTGRNLGNNLLK